MRHGFYVMNVMDEVPYLATRAMSAARDEREALLILAGLDGYEPEMIRAAQRFVERDVKMQREAERFMTDMMSLPPFWPR